MRLCLGHAPDPSPFVPTRPLPPSPAVSQRQKNSPTGNILVEGDEDSSPRSSAETAAGKSRGILLMLQGQVR